MTTPEGPVSPPPMRRESAWALVDQICSSGTNFVPSLVLARVLGPSDFGTFSLAFLAWFLTLSVVRSALMQPYTLAAAALTGPAWSALTARAAGAVVLAGGLAGVAFAAAAVAVGLDSELGPSLLAVAVLAPGLALQEFWRVASFASSRARTAAANDAWWAVGQAAAFTALLLATSPTAAWSLLAWGAGAWLAALIGLRQLSVRPRLDRSALTWARGAARLGLWFTGANATFAFGLFGVAALVAIKLGQDDLGLFRMVQGNLFGPVQLLTIAAESVFLPHFVRSIRGSSTGGLAEAVRYSAVVVVVVVSYGLLLRAVAPAVLDNVFGSGFAPATALVLPMLVVFALDAGGSGASILLRARAHGAHLVVTQVVSTAIRLAAVVLLMRAVGLVGAVWGLAIGSGVAAVFFWTFARRTVTAPAAPVPVPVPGYAALDVAEEVAPPGRARS
jgi:O-antigen/teichoic acid export membrane protein